MNTNQLKLRALHLRHLIGPKEEQVKQNLEENAHFIWLDDARSKPSPNISKSQEWSG